MDEMSSGERPERRSSARPASDCSAAKRKRPGSSLSHASMKFTPLLHLRFEGQSRGAQSDFNSQRGGRTGQNAFRAHWQRACSACTLLAITLMQVALQSCWPASDCIETHRLQTPSKSIMGRRSLVPKYSSPGWPAAAAPAPAVSAAAAAGGAGAPPPTAARTNTAARLLRRSDDTGHPRRATCTL